MNGFGTERCRMFRPKKAVDGMVRYRELYLKAVDMTPVWAIYETWADTGHASLRHVALVVALKWLGYGRSETEMMTRESVAAEE